jgi:hypothetical protein
MTEEALVAVRYVNVILHGGPQPGPLRVPTLDGALPPTLDMGTASEMVQYVRGTDEVDHLGRPVYRPDPLLHFRWAEPGELGGDDEATESSAGDPS